MGWLANAFTWWNGASWGTSIVTRRHGKEVGRDEAGNLYFQHKDDPKRRWVIYAGNNDGSRVPPGWQSWLRGTIDELPERVDVVDVFRRSANVPKHVEEIVALPPERRPKVVWLQSGIRHDAATERLLDAGIDVVSDRCLGVYASRYR